MESIGAISAHDGYELVGLGNIHLGTVGFKAISSLESFGAIPAHDGYELAGFVDLHLRIVVSEQFRLWSLSLESIWAISAHDGYIHFKQF